MTTDGELANYIEINIIPTVRAKLKRQITFDRHLVNLRAGIMVGQHAWSNLHTVLSMSCELTGISAEPALTYCKQRALLHELH